MCVVIDGSIRARIHHPSGIRAPCWTRPRLVSDAGYHVLETGAGALRGKKSKSGVWHLSGCMK